PPRPPLHGPGSGTALAHGSRNLGVPCPRSPPPGRPLGLPSGPGPLSPDRARPPGPRRGAAGVGGRRCGGGGPGLGGARGRRGARGGERAGVGGGRPGRRAYRGTSGLTPLRAGPVSASAGETPVLPVGRGLPVSRAGRAPIPFSLVTRV